MSAPTVVVTCAECGVDFYLSARREYEHRKRGMPALCGACRHPPKPPDPRTLRAMRRWWLDRFTLDELQSWPPL